MTLTIMWHEDTWEIYEREALESTSTLYAGVWKSFRNQTITLENQTDGKFQITLGTGPPLIGPCATRFRDTYTYRYLYRYTYNYRYTYTFIGPIKYCIVIVFVFVFVVIVIVIVDVIILDNAIVIVIALNPCYPRRRELGMLWYWPNQTLLLLLSLLLLLLLLLLFLLLLMTRALGMLWSTCIFIGPIKHYCTPLIPYRTKYILIFRPIWIRYHLGFVKEWQRWTTKRRDV